ncbi:MAG: pyridoxal-dependent decarboxylase [Planctomycetota bacterium]
MNDRPLHDPEAFREAAHRLVDRLADHLDASLRGAVPARPDATPLVRRAEWRLPGADGSDTDESALELLERAITQAHHIHSPHSVGHQVSPPVPIAVLADFVASFLNNSSAIFDMGPVATSMEVELVDWMGQQLDFPNSRGGALVNGGSIGNLTAMLAIRQAKTAGDAWADGTDGRRYCVLSSAQTHYCVRRAVQILGFGHDGLIEVPVDREFRLDSDQLEDALERAHSMGRTPLAVVGSAGSTSTGAIDPLDRIADFCDRHDLWFHVDGAHGASFVLSERERKALSGIERADSVVWDAHKTMLVSSLCTGVLFRDAGHLDRAFAQKAEYLFQPDPDSELTLDLGRHTIECTKPWLGLKLFTVLRSPGAEAIARYLENCCDTVRGFADEVDRCEDFETAHSPDLNIFCFRHRPVGLDGSALDAHQDEIRTAVIARTGGFLTRTALEDPVTGDTRVWLRITVLHPETTLATLLALLEDLRKEGAARALRS